MPGFGGSVQVPGPEGARSIRFRCCKNIDLVKVTGLRESRFLPVADQRIVHPVGSHAQFEQYAVNQKVVGE